MDLNAHESSSKSMYAAPPIANLLVIRSPDLERAVTFYTQMGLLMTLEAHGKGPQHYASGVNGFVFEIYPLRPGDAPTTSTRFGFSVDCVDSVVELLSELGATIITPPADSPWGRRAVVRDFDGHTVELTTPPQRPQSIRGAVE